MTDSVSIADLKYSYRGPLFTPSDDGYETGRRVWNGNIDRRPALIARCTGVTDVMEAVKFAEPASSWRRWDAEPTARLDTAPATAESSST